jgi:hypothetical protein
MNCQKGKENSGFFSYRIFFLTLLKPDCCIVILYIEDRFQFKYGCAENNIFQNKNITSAFNLPMHVQILSMKHRLSSVADYSRTGS